MPFLLSLNCNCAIGIVAYSVVCPQKTRYNCASKYTSEWNTHTHKKWLLSVYIVFCVFFSLFGSIFLYNFLFVTAFVELFMCVCVYIWLTIDDNEQKIYTTTGNKCEMFGIIRNETKKKNSKRVSLYVFCRIQVTRYANGILSPYDSVPNWIQIERYEIESKQIWLFYLFKIFRSWRFV